MTDSENDDRKPAAVHKKMSSQQKRMVRRDKKMSMKSKKSKREQKNETMRTKYWKHISPIIGTQPNLHISSSTSGIIGFQIIASFYLSLGKLVHQTNAKYFMI